MNNTISAVVLTANEEDNIARCLNSLKWCDEILLIDNSKDQTVEFAERLKLKQLKIITDGTTTDFATLRNKALELAKHEWVLFVDADEEVTEELRNEILNTLQIHSKAGHPELVSGSQSLKDSIIKKIPKQVRNDNSAEKSQIDGYFIPRRDYFLGKWLKHGETGNIKLLKLGRKDRGQWTRPVHEVWNIEKTGELSNYLNHYPHPTIAEFLKRIHRWSTLDAKEFYKQGVKSNFPKVVCYPAGKFFQNYFVRLGFLDGMPGLIMALMMSFHSFLTRAKLYIIQNSPQPSLKKRGSSSSF